MNTLTNCQNCGQPLASDVSQGLCPACLMKIGLGIGTGTGPATDSSGIGPVVAFVPPSPEYLQRLLPQFVVLGMIGRGGMGAVYRARQKSLDRVVALKILAKRADQDPKFNERFALEARTLARLSHPNIISVFDFGEVAGLCYLVMEYVDGVNLRQMLQAQKMAPKEALAIVPDLCAALQYAHDQGIVHRDIKPENILIDRQGRVKVADFGLAKLIEPESGRADLPVSPNIRAAQQHGPTGVVGTPHYMAPEQIEHPQAVDHRADIFSLGVVFYEMLTGELPIGKFAPPSFKVQIDVRLDEVVLRALEKEPERRYQQASQVNTALETIASQPSLTSAGSSKAPAPSDSPIHSPEVENKSPDAIVDSAELPPEAQAVKARLRFASLILLVLGLATYGTFFIETPAANILPPAATAAARSLARSLLQLCYRLVNGIPRDLQMLDMGNLSHLLSPLALVAAWQLRKGRGFAFANLAIVGSFFHFSSLLWTVPLGIFGLRQLWRKDVRAAFAAVEKQGQDHGTSTEEARDNYRLAITSAGLVLVSLVCLPVFVVGRADIGDQLGLVSVVVYWVRWLPHLAQGAGIVLGTLALMAMPRMGSHAKGLGWALLGTLFPLLVCLASCCSATHTPFPYPVFSPYDMEPRAEQYVWQGLWATLAASLVAGWAVYYQAKNLRHGGEKTVLRMLHWICWTIGIMVVAYAVIGMAKYWLIHPNWKSHLANLAQVVLVAAGVGWLASRSLQRSSSNSTRVILRRVKWVSWGVGLLVLAYMGIYLLSVQYRRMLDNARGGESNGVTLFLAQHHTHAQAPSGSEAKAVTARSASGSIELTMVSEPTASNVVCWLPDGTIRCAEKPPLSQPAEVRTDRRTLVFGLAGYGQTTNLASLHWECWVTIAGVEKICPVGYPYLNANNQGFNGLCFTVPGDAQTARLRLGIPEPTWEDTDAVWLWTGDQRGLRKKSIRRGGEDWEFGFMTVKTENGLSVFFTSQIKRDAEARLIAVDAEGTIHEPLDSSGAYSPEWLGRTVNYLVSFGGLDVTQLKELRFQVRPFRWIEFQNISLRPGQRTPVEVKESGATASGTPQPTTPTNP